MLPGLSGGRCNTGIKIVNMDGKQFVERSYESGTIALGDFKKHVAMATDIGLTPSDAWYFHENDEGIVYVVSCPFG